MIHAWMHTLLQAHTILPIFFCQFLLHCPTAPPHLPPSPQPFLSVFINKKAGYIYTRKYNLEVVMFNIITICKTGEELYFCFLIRIQLGFFFLLLLFYNTSPWEQCVSFSGTIFFHHCDKEPIKLDVMRFHPLPNTPDEADEQAHRFRSKILSWHSY